MNKKWYEAGPFSVFDLETTGFGPTKERIVEIAATRIDIDGTRTKFHTLINPMKAIGYHAQRVHKISAEMVKDSPPFEHIGQDFLDFIEGSILVAHNAKFDLSFLQESLNRSCLPLWEGKTLDTLTLAKKCYPDLPKHTLQYLRTRLDFKSNVGEAHRAFADVEWTVELLEMILSSVNN